MSTSTFHMQNQLQAVDPMVLTLKGHLEDQLTYETLMRFDICMSEALANLVLHAETEQKDAPIDLTFNFDGDVLTVDIFDPEGAKAFDIRKQARALSDVDVMAESGRGLGLILECADGVEYGPVQNRRCLSLKFQARN
ncbi:ATP-binding protein [Pacificibacter sp. AS14]|uniref:ATP-binding protein n=1 Tax=Pacificibacter sp. AS14 TaxID=3135785 RepID=UPI00316BD8E8